ncbi:nucleoporin NUP188-like isoform X2 [Oscarella lobularis]|uniref:nucleoporin NUP188-like isoform X2 n=1 Tax=Oscarella lobularis TaxID=121494 RepID=UPI0033131E32
MAEGSFRSLFSILTGRSALREPAQIADELTRNAEKFSKGNAAYAKPSESSEKNLKSTKSIRPPTLKFVSKLSRFLGLDQMQTLDLVRNFLMDEYRGSSSQLQTIFKNERDSHALMMSVLRYYFDERLTVYRCLKHLFEYWQDSRHPCRETYTEFVDKHLIAGRKLIGALIQHYKELCDTNAPTSETNGELMTPRVSARWAVQYIREQIELLDVVVLHYRDFQMDATQLVEIAQLFQVHGFGTRQVNKHLLDANADNLIYQIGFLQTVILIEGIDLDWMLNNAQPETAAGHHLVQAVAQKTAFDEMLANWNDSPFHSPVFLAWATFCSLADDAETAVKIGSRALQTNVFKVLCTIVKADCFSNNSVVDVAVKTTVHVLLAAVLMVFDESALGNSLGDVVAVLCETMAVRRSSNEFWTQRGFGSLLTSVQSRFPYSYFLVDLLTALSGHADAPAMVLEYLKNVNYFTEPFSDALTDFEESEKEAEVRLCTEREAYKTVSDSPPSLVIPAGTLGRLFSDRRNRLVRWDFRYSAWHFFILEFDFLLHSVNLGTDIDSLPLVIRVTSVVRLVKQMLVLDPALSTSLYPLLERTFQVIQKFGSSPNPPQDLIKSCIDCVTVICQNNAELAWTGLQQTGFLPHTLGTTKGTGFNISPGNFGHVLRVKERPTGSFRVTVATLEMIGAMIRHADELGGDLAASIVFVVHEIFATFHKWRYVDGTERKRIGEGALKIFECSLNCDQLRALVTQALLYSEAGQALLNMLSIGVDAVDGFAAVSFLKGALQVVIQLLNSTGEDLSVIEEALANQMVERPTTAGLPQVIGDKVHIVSIIASYIHHRHDPELPVLSTRLLGRLCKASPMSLYGCLGPNNTADSIRDAYALRLAARTEDIKLKVAILKMLAVSVETQPGLTELLLDLKSKDKNGRQEFEIGRNSCLAPTLAILSSRNRGLVPLELLSAALKFLASLWKNRKDAALSTIRNKDGIWADIMGPLMTGLPVETSTITDSHCQVAAHAMRVVALECFYVAKGEMDEALKKLLRDFGSEGKLEMWISAQTKKTADAGISDRIKLKLLKVTRTLLLVASNVDLDVFRLSNEANRKSILSSLLEAVDYHVNSSLSRYTLAAAPELSTLYTVLFGCWPDAVQPRLSLLEKITSILREAKSKSTELSTAIETPLYSSTIVILQRRPNEIHDLDHVVEIIRLASLSLQQPTLAGDSSSKKSTIVQLLVMCEAVQVMPDPSRWLFTLESNATFLHLVQALDFNLKTGKDVALVDAVMHFFVVLALRLEPARQLALLGVHRSLCLYLNWQDEPDAAVANGSLETSALDSGVQKPTWTRIWCLSVAFISSLLKTLRHEFVDEALDFVGAHHEKLAKSLDAVRGNLSRACLEEADHIAALLANLSLFRRQWQFSIPRVFTDLNERMGFLCQACCALLSRPQFLSHLVEVASERLAVPSKSSHESESLPRTREGAVAKHVRFSGDVQTQSSSSSGRKRVPSTSSSIELSSSSPLFLKIQRKLLSIMTHCLTFVRNLEPNLYKLMNDTAFDLADYPPLLLLRFDSPAMETVTPPSFGTLIAAINACLGILPKPSRIATPTRSPIRTASPAEEDRFLVMLVIEHSLWILLTEAVMCLRSSGVEFRVKQLLKRELGSDLGNILSYMLKFFSRRSGPSTPSKKSPAQDRILTSSAFSDEDSEQRLFQLTDLFMKQVLR